MTPAPTPLTIPEAVAAVFELRTDPAPACRQALSVVVEGFNARTGTLHAVDPTGIHLRLVAAYGVPAPIMQKIQNIPFGKGMAGLCAEQRRPVTVCNLQSDTSGKARPGAKATGVAGAIVVPVLSVNGSTLRGTLGIGMAAAHAYTDEECDVLNACARQFADFVQQG